MHIVFNSTDASSSELYIVNINQPEAIKITKRPRKKTLSHMGQIDKHFKKEEKHEKILSMDDLYLLQLHVYF